MAGTIFRAGPGRVGLFATSALAFLRALQLPPAPEPELLHLRYRPNLRPLAAPRESGREPDARAPVPGRLVRDFSHEGDLMAWLTHCHRPAELPAGAGRL